jgi:hypothetical protein
MTAFLISVLIFVEVVYLVRGIMTDKEDEVFADQFEDFEVVEDEE